MCQDFVLIKGYPGTGIFISLHYNNISVLSFKLNFIPLLWKISNEFTGIKMPVDQTEHVYLFKTNCFWPSYFFEYIQMLGAI